MPYQVMLVPFCWQALPIKSFFEFYPHTLINRLNPFIHRSFSYGSRTLYLPDSNFYSHTEFLLLIYNVFIIRIICIFL